MSVSASLHSSSYFSTDPLRGKEESAHLLESAQTVGAAQQLAAILGLQAQRPGAVRAAAFAGEQVVDGAEAVETRVAADLVDHTLQNHLMFALQEKANRSRCFSFCSTCRRTWSSCPPYDAVSPADAALRVGGEWNPRKLGGNHALVVEGGQAGRTAEVLLCPHSVHIGLKDVLRVAYHPGRTQTHPFRAFQNRTGLRLIEDSLQTEVALRLDGFPLVELQQTGSGAEQICVGLPLVDRLPVHQSLPTGGAGRLRVRLAQGGRGGIRVLRQREHRTDP